MHGEHMNCIYCNSAYELKITGMKKINMLS